MDQNISKNGKIHSDSEPENENKQGTYQNPLQQQRRGRGRPRKNQIVQTNEKIKKEKMVKLSKTISDKNEVDDEIILHLPISFKDLDMKKNKDHDENKSSPNSNIFTINDINSESTSDSSNFEVNDVVVHDLKEKIKNQEKYIRQLEKEIEDYKDMLSEDNMHGLVNRKVHKMDTNLIDSTSGKKMIVEKTDIACWWCGHTFDSPPCFIPEKFYDDEYFVFGCFCSYNCAASYNLKMEDAFVWDRYSLLKKLYNVNFIPLAPPREAFKRLGGPISFDEFRKNCQKCTRDFRFIMPPMTSIVPMIEEGNVEPTRVNISLAELNKKSNLRRNKPLPNSRTTLFETLGIKEVSVKK